MTKRTGHEGGAFRLAPFLLGLALACRSNGETAVVVDVVAEAAWGLTRYEMVAGGKRGELNPVSTVRLLVADELAGKLLPILVWGKKDSERYAHGETSVTPVRGAEVRTTVTLSRLPCGAWCTPGAKTCQGDGTVECERREDDDRCFKWGAVTPCPATAAQCSSGTCAATCVDECAKGETRCDGPGGFRPCGQADRDPCLDWLPNVACGQGATCAAGTCGPTCRGACTAGALACSGAGTTTCSDLDHDGCTEWGPEIPCTPGQSCTLGNCGDIDKCTDECTASRCDGLSFRRCGQYDVDPCLELSPGTSCVPADGCTEGMCDATAGCKAAPKVCLEPPMATCKDASTLRTYDAVGVCKAGVCEYTPHDTACPMCPSCDPCAGIVCDKPPPADCPAPFTLRTYAVPGSCSGGSCAYTPSEMTCAWGCVGGACVPAPELPRAGLVGEWLFEGNADDTSGNMNDGTILGASPTVDRQGRPAAALTFDGIDDFVEVPDDTSLDLTGDFTISAWVSVAELRRLSGIVSKYRTFQGHGCALRLRENPPFDALDLNEAEARSLGPSPPGDRLDTLGWHHVAGVLRTGVAEVYVDGVLSLSAAPAYALKANTDALAIGLDYGANDPRYFKGSIDDVRLYERALTLPELAQLAGERCPAGSCRPTPTRCAVGSADRALDCFSGCSPEMFSTTIFTDELDDPVGFASRWGTSYVAPTVSDGGLQFGPHPLTPNWWENYSPAGTLSTFGDALTCVRFRMTPATESDNNLEIWTRTQADADAMVFGFQGSLSKINLATRIAAGPMYVGHAEAPFTLTPGLTRTIDAAVLTEGNDFYAEARNVDTTEIGSLRTRAAADASGKLTIIGWMLKNRLSVERVVVGTPSPAARALMMKTP